mgnify:CR=1 FL=1
MAYVECAQAEKTDSRIGDRIVDLEIAVEVPGWTDSVAVASPGNPGAVRGAVERLLRDLGLPRR